MTRTEWETTPSLRDTWTGFADDPNGMGIAKLLDPKGGDMSEWPEELRVREFPSTKGR